MHTAAREQSDCLWYGEHRASDAGTAQLYFSSPTSSSCGSFLRLSPAGAKTTRSRGRTHSSLTAPFRDAVGAHFCEAHVEGPLQIVEGVQQHRRVFAPIGGRGAGSALIFGPSRRSGCPVHAGPGRASSPRRTSTPPDRNPYVSESTKARGFSPALRCLRPVLVSAVAPLVHCLTAISRGSGRRRGAHLQLRRLPPRLSSGLRAGRAVCGRHRRARRGPAARQHRRHAAR